MNNLIMPGRGLHMGDGWETKRNRTPGNNDWVVIKLATPGTIERIVADTGHFKGNYPDSCSVEGCYSADDNAALSDTLQWQTILPQQKLSADAEHEFIQEITGIDVYSHVRLTIYPDGGISRLRLFGKVKR
jgi:allantoicase